MAESNDDRTDGEDYSSPDSDEDDDDEDYSSPDSDEDEDEDEDDEDYSPSDTGDSDSDEDEDEDESEEESEDVRSSIVTEGDSVGGNDEDESEEDFSVDSSSDDIEDKSEVSLVSEGDEESEDELDSDDYDNSDEDDADTVHDDKIVMLSYRSNQIKTGEGTNWFTCGQRIYDENKKLYYLNIPSTNQFYEEKTGKMYKVASSEKKMLILSDKENKSTLCQNYGILCGCDSNRSTLSRNCDLVKEKKLLEIVRNDKIKSLGFDGAVIKHEIKYDYLDCPENPICHDLTFVFTKASKNLTVIPFKNSSLYNFAIKANSCIKSRIHCFPEVGDIEMMTNKDEIYASKSLFEIIKKYMQKKYAT